MYRVSEWVSFVLQIRTATCVVPGKVYWALGGREGQASVFLSSKTPTVAVVLFYKSRSFSRSSTACVAVRSRRFSRSSAACVTVDLAVDLAVGLTVGLHLQYIKVIRTPSATTLLVAFQLELCRTRGIQQRLYIVARACDAYSTLPTDVTTREAVGDTSLQAGTNHPPR